MDKGGGTVKITREMRLTRALKYLEEEKKAEEQALRALENVHLQEVIILRNRKQMYIAQIDQMIRNIQDELPEARLADRKSQEVQVS